VRLRALVAERPLSAAAVVGWAAAVLVASVVSPSAGTGGLSTAGPLDLVGVDKWLHALAYATLAALVATARRARTRRELLAAALVSAGFGATVEAIQLSLPARSGDPADAVANAVGAVVGVAVWCVGVRLLAWVRSE
jgi:VanZ family protein